VLRIEKRTETHLYTSKYIHEHTHMQTHLQRENGGGLEAQVVLEVLGDLSDQALEGQLAQEQLGALLVLADLAEGDGAGTVAVGLLDAARGGGGLTGGLGGQLERGREEMSDGC
jgi:hypothetical protein